MSKDAQHIPDRDAMKRRLIEMLQRRTLRKRTGDGPRPVSAIALAVWLELQPGSSHENKRRRIRDLVKELREDGIPIGSCLTGYFFAVEPKDHEKFQAGMRRHGVAILATASRDKRAAITAEQAGQLRLSFAGGG